MLGPRQGPCDVQIFGIEKKPARVTLNGKALETWRHDEKEQRVDVEVRALESGLTIRVERAE